MATYNCDDYVEVRTGRNLDVPGERWVFPLTVK